MLTVHWTVILISAIEYDFLSQSVHYSWKVSIVLYWALFLSLVLGRIFSPIQCIITENWLLSLSLLLNRIFWTSHCIIHHNHKLQHLILCNIRSKYSIMIISTGTYSASAYTTPIQHFDCPLISKIFRIMTPTTRQERENIFIHCTNLIKNRMKYQQSRCNYRYHQPWWQKYKNIPQNLTWYQNQNISNNNTTYNASIQNNIRTLIAFHWKTS